MLNKILLFIKKYWEYLVIVLFAVLFFVYYSLYVSLKKDLNQALVSNNVLDRMYEEKNQEFLLYKEDKEQELNVLTSAIDRTQSSIKQKESRLSILNAKFYSTQQVLVDIQNRIEKEKQFRNDQAKKVYTPEELDNRLIYILRN